MKKWVIGLFFMGTLGFGQNFFETDEEYEEPVSQNSMFQSQPEYEEPDQEVNLGPSNPGEGVPIDNGVFLLPLAGILVGFYFLNRKPKTA